MMLRNVGKFLSYKRRQL